MDWEKIARQKYLPLLSQMWIVRTVPSVPLIWLFTTGWCFFFSPTIQKKKEKREKKKTPCCCGTVQNIADNHREQWRGLWEEPGILIFDRRDGYRLGGWTRQTWGRKAERNHLIKCLALCWTLTVRKDRWHQSSLKVKPKHLSCLLVAGWSIGHKPPLP